MRFAKRKVSAGSWKQGDSLKLGFVPTLDCAILIAAQELDLFAKYDLRVTLSREVGWATIREKILHEELDAAAAHASMLFSIYYGLGVVRRPCLTGMLLGLNGSAITLSNELWALGARDATSLGRVIAEHKGRRTFTFGVVLELSSQNLNLRSWLRSGGINPDHDVQVAVVPSALIFENCREGYLDGYCVAEPWNSLAALSGVGWIAAHTCEISPEHPEKVLLVNQDFAEQREEEHIRLIAALLEAAAFCDQPENRPALARMLALPRYFNVAERFVANSLAGSIETGRERRSLRDFVIFDPERGCRPTREKGRRVFDLVRSLGPEKAIAALRPNVIGKIFREDIFQKATALVERSAKRNHARAESAFFFNETTSAPCALEPVAAILTPDLLTFGPAA